jgi:mRNA interferase RelE/StbE
MSKGRKQPSPQPAPTEAEPTRKFEPRFTPDAAGDIQGLDGSVRKHLKSVLEKKLAINPEGYGSPLRGLLVNYWRHEFATHRVIYRIYPDQGIVVVCAVGPRKQGDREDIYERLEGLAKTGRLAEQIISVLGSIIPRNK